MQRNASRQAAHAVVFLNSSMARAKAPFSDRFSAAYFDAFSDRPRKGRDLQRVALCLRMVESLFQSANPVDTYGDQAEKEEPQETVSEDFFSDDR
jgi:hypothetical protein